MKKISLKRIMFILIILSSLFTIIYASSRENLDFITDGIINLKDAKFLTQYYGDSPPTNSNTDINGDNIVDLLDIASLLQQDGTEAESFINPMGNYYYVTSSEFGYRIHPVYGTYRLHTGIDLAVPNGDYLEKEYKAYATRSGKIVKAAYNEYSLGNYVVIDHDDGYFSLYLHGLRTLVEEGQMVNQGDEVLVIGATGATTGAHLHFELRKSADDSITDWYNGAVAFDPRDVVSGIKYPVVQYGESGTSNVYRLQIKLIEYGYDIEADGSFGPITQATVEDFQATHDIEVDGICGPITWAALESELAKFSALNVTDDLTDEQGTGAPNP